MASRFWVGGSGNWNGINTTNWAATSGGAGGETVPTSSDNVIFDAASNAGSYTVTVTANANCADIDFTNPAGGTLTLAGNANLNPFGSFTIHSTITRTFTGNITFSAIATGKTITTNGISLNSAVSFNGTGGGWTLQDDFTNAGATTFVKGSFDANNHNVTSATFTLSGTGAKVLTMGSGTWTVTGASWNVTGSNITISPGTSTVKLTSASSPLFAGGGKTYYNLWFSDTTSPTFSIEGSNTFNQIKDTNTSGHDLLFQDATTTTFADFVVSGNAGNLIRLSSESGGTYTLVKTGGGTVSCDYLDIYHSIATPADTFYAGTHSTDHQSVAPAGSGWIFSSLTLLGNAAIDENNRESMIGLLNTSGTVIIKVTANPTAHSLGISDGTDGTDNGGTHAEFDGNYKMTLWAVSSADGVTPIPLYADGSGRLLIKST